MLLAGGQNYRIARLPSVWVARVAHSGWSGL